jgi:hypothetical protein
VSTIVREWKPAAEGKWIDREYTDEEIVDLFGDDGNCLVIALLRRAQDAEKKEQEVRKILAHIDAKTVMTAKAKCGLASFVKAI